MTMTASLTWPLTPLHLLMAALLALALWRFEQRLTRLRAEIARQLHALMALGCRDQAPLNPRVCRSALLWYGANLFARPPPSTYACS